MKSKSNVVSTENIISTGGMRTVLTRGGSLDLGFYHTDPNRCKMTLEMYVNIGRKYGTKNEKQDNICLAMRCLGGKKDEIKGRNNVQKTISNTSSLLESLKSTGVVWSLSVDYQGALSFIIGNENNDENKNENKNIIKSSLGSINLNNFDNSKNDNNENDDQNNDNENEDDNENENDNNDMNRASASWYHIVLVIDSTSNFNNIENDIPNIKNNNNATRASVSLFVNSERVAIGEISVPPINEDILALPGCLYIGPCLPVGSRITELRVVRYSFLFFSIFVSIFGLILFLFSIFYFYFYLFIFLFIYLFFDNVMFFVYGIISPFEKYLNCF